MPKKGIRYTTESLASSLAVPDLSAPWRMCSIDQEINGHTPVPIEHIPNLCGLNVNPKDAIGVHQQRLNGVMGLVHCQRFKFVLPTISMGETLPHFRSFRPNLLTAVITVVLLQILFERTEPSRYVA